MNKVGRISFIILAAVILLSLSACSLLTANEIEEPTTEPTTEPTPEPAYTVTFDLNGGELISGEAVQTVQEGSDAVAPEVTNGRLELSWDGAYTGVRDDVTVTAQWTKVAMNTTDLAEYVQARTVTVNVTTISGNESAGSGFFIDDKGTIVTNYHVIDSATEMSVEIGSGGTFDVESIVDFSDVYDLAILKIDMTGNEYLDISQEAVKTGESVYAVGSPLGTLTGSFTAGIVSSESRPVGLIDCIQMDAAISTGNSGGPLVNEYGEVVGINAFSYINGEDLNLSINVSTLDLLTRDKNYSFNEYKEWYITETSRSYSLYDRNGGYYYSTINTYQVITDSPCLYSYDNEKEKYYDGYRDMHEHYVYNYIVSEYDEYVEYLKEIGFVYQDHEEFRDGTSYYYLNEKDGHLVDLFVSSDKETLSVYVTLEY